MRRGWLIKPFALLTRLQQWRRLRLTSLGALIAGGAVGAGVFSVDTQQTLAFQITSLLVSLLAISLLFAARFRPRLRVERRLPDYATVGVPISYSIRLHNLSSKEEQLSLGLVDQLNTALPSAADYRNHREAPRIDNWFDRILGFRRWLRLVTLHRGAKVDPVSVSRLAPNDLIEVTLSLLPLRRGYIYFESTVLQRPDPLGLLNAIARYLTPQPLLVLPRRYRVPVIALGNHRRYQPGGMHLASNVGDSREFLSLRDYNAGDPLRHIHWRSWAKTGKPIVKQFQDEFFNRQALILDTFGNPGACFEEAVSIAASFVLGQHETDALTDLLFVGTRAVQASAGRGLGSTAHLLELLACVQPASAQDFDALRRLVMQSVTKLSGAIVVLLAWDTRRQEFIRELRALQIPLVVLIVTEADPQNVGPGPLRDEPGRLCVVRPSHVEDDLAALTRPNTNNFRKATR